MYCENCGIKLEENANFCGNCGNEIINKTIEKIEDNEILLTVKPTFNYDYNMFPYIIVYMIVALMGSMISSLISKYIVFLFLIGSFLIFLGIMWLKTTIKKKEYENISFDFYKTKVKFKDDYLIKIEKEVNYKNMKEIIMTQTYMQKKYNLGNIILYTNVEGYGSSIAIANVENVQTIYNKIKKIINL